MRALLLTALLGAFAFAAHAQEEPAPDWIRPESILPLAEELDEQLEAAATPTRTREALDEIEESLSAVRPRIDELAERTEAAIEAGATLTQLRDLEQELEALALPLLGDWTDSIEDEATRVAELLELLERSEKRWSNTVRQPETAEAGSAVARRARDSLQLVRQAKARVLAWRSRVFGLEDRIAGARLRVDAKLDLLTEAQSKLRQSLLIPEAAPIWDSGFADDLRAELPQVREALGGLVEQCRAYVVGESRPLAAQAIVALLLVLLFREAGRRAAHRGEDDPELASATRVLARPISIGLLLALLATPWLHPLAPLRFHQLMILLALIPVFRILTLAFGGTDRWLLASLFALLVLDRLGLALITLPAVTQAVYVVALGAAVALSAYVLRRGGLPGSPVLVRRGAAFALTAFTLALLAKIGGWVGLSALVGRGALVAVLAGVYVSAAVVAIDALLAWALRSPRWARFGMVQTEGQLSERRAGLLVRLLGVALWLYLVLGAIAVREITMDAVRVLLAAGVSVGALSLTVGGVLAFVLTIVLAPLFARFLVLVLEQGVFPRTSLPRGIPYAITTLVRYAVFVLAFLLALAAAGVQLSQLSILLGGLGVGVGLGLQDVVKNFAAGLTVLFERRVHVGDVVQIRGIDIFGRVLEIGMRASVVRNWDGAEVVVPNGDLVASAVTNWTLSDQLRRIEIPVGVAYGTDPDRVVALLLEVAEQNSEVLAHPTPQALFQGFGDSSLDFLLRGWVDTVYDRTLAIRSELVLAIHRALREAGITIPFPQRDLHLASVSPAARAVILGREATEAAREAGLASDEKPRGD
jgi:small-conductance mechanosensitive channel